MLFGLFCVMLLVLNVRHDWRTALVRAVFYTPIFFVVALIVGGMYYSASGQMN